MDRFLLVVFPCRFSSRSMHAFIRPTLWLKEHGNALLWWNYVSFCLCCCENLILKKVGRSFCCQWSNRFQQFLFPKQRMWAWSLFHHNFFSWSICFNFPFSASTDQCDLLWCPWSAFLIPFKETNSLCKSRTWKSIVNSRKFKQTMWKLPQQETMVNLSTIKMLLFSEKHIQAQKHDG